MAVRIRLARHGAKKSPYYRVVVSDGRSPRDGRFICEVGRYDPQQNPLFLKLDLETVDEWIAKGAQPSDTVARLITLAREGGPAEKSAEPKPSKKTLEKAAKAEEEAAAAAAAAAEAAAAEAEAAAAPEETTEEETPASEEE